DGGHSLIPDTIQNEYSSQLLELLGEQGTANPEFMAVNNEKKPKAKAACKKRAVDDPEPARAASETRADDDHAAAKPKQNDRKGKRKIENLPEKHAEDEEKKKARMEASQAKADEMCKVIRASGILDLQPPLGFTSKYHDCNDSDCDAEQLLH
ncbi:unnamed protein product, partial [Symbiodinium sp. KB8]